MDSFWDGFKKKAEDREESWKSKVLPAAAGALTFAALLPSAAYAGGSLASGFYRNNRKTMKGKTLELAKDVALHASVLPMNIAQTILHPVHTYHSVFSHPTGLNKKEFAGVLGGIALAALASHGAEKGTEAIQNKLTSKED